MPKLEIVAMPSPKPGVAPEHQDDFPAPAPPKYLSVDDLETLRLLVDTTVELPPNSANFYLIESVENIVTGSGDEVNFRPSYVLVKYEWPVKV